MSKWYMQTGPEADAVISTRIRLARNLRGYPFPCKMNAAQMAEVTGYIRDAILNSNSALAKEFSYIDMTKLSKIQAVSLVERHLVSPEFISEREGRGLLITKDESISIMINEEDHLRVQVMAQGLNLDAAYDLAAKLDTLLDEVLSFAFDDHLGYLTQCPTNLGTGMRASLMLHLPALQESGAMQRISNNLSKIGLTIRGLYGEGSEPKGSVYQLSNQVTLGLSERAAIDNLKDIAMQIIQQERSLRQSMVNSDEFQDMVWRSLGILKTARLLSNEEFMKLISNVRLGISSGILDHITLDTVNQLMIEAQPATLMQEQEKELPPHERDKLRAKLVQQSLA